MIVWLAGYQETEAQQYRSVARDGTIVHAERSYGYFLRLEEHSRSGE
jgi:hypothetical protein